MIAESRTTDDHSHLTISLDSGRVPVSYVSSLLRVLQAALREIGKASAVAGSRFEQRPPPILLLSRIESDGELRMTLHFSDPAGGKPMKRLSSQVFNAFLDQFSEFVRDLPQPSLFGGAARGSPRRVYDSTLARRLDQVYRELRRSPRVTLSLGRRNVRIEGDAMEIT